MTAVGRLTPGSPISCAAKKAVADQPGLLPAALAVLFLGLRLFQLLGRVMDQTINHCNDAITSLGPRRIRTVEQAEIELNDEEAPFLAGQTTKTSLNLQPIKITKNPDGSLMRAAMNQAQRAKERKDIRD